MPVLGNFNSECLFNFFVRFQPMFVCIANDLCFLNLCVNCRFVAVHLPVLEMPQAGGVGAVGLSVAIIAGLLTFSLHKIEEGLHKKLNLGRVSDPYNEC